MGIFQEYLNSRGKIEKGEVSISGDRIDPKTPPNKPPKGEKPYVGKDGGKSSKPFGDQGDKDLKYEPATDLTNKGKAPAKIPTVEQVELSTLVTDAAAKDITVIEQLIVQLKRRGLLGPLVAEMLQHRETYQHIAEIATHESYGPEVCSRLTRAMNEEVASPFAADIDPEKKGKNEPSAVDVEKTQDQGPEAMDDADSPTDATNQDIPVPPPNAPGQAPSPTNPLMKMRAMMAKHMKSK